MWFPKGAKFKPNQEASWYVSLVFDLSSVFCLPESPPSHDLPVKMWYHFSPSSFLNLSLRHLVRLLSCNLALTSNQLESKQREEIKNDAPSRTSKTIGCIVGRHLLGRWELRMLLGQSCIMFIISCITNNHASANIDPPSCGLTFSRVYFSPGEFGSAWSEQNWRIQIFEWCRHDRLEARIFHCHRRTGDYTQNCTNKLRKIVTFLKLCRLHMHSR